MIEINILTLEDQDIYLENPFSSGE